MYNGDNVFRMLPDEIDEGCLNIVGRNEHVEYRKINQSNQRKRQVHVLVVTVEDIHKIDDC